MKTIRKQGLSNNVYNVYQTKHSLANRHTNCMTRRQRHYNRSLSKQANKQANKQTNKQTDKQSNKQTSKQTNKQTNNNEADITINHTEQLKQRTSNHKKQQKQTIIQND